MRTALVGRPWLYKDAILRGPGPDAGPFVDLVDENTLPMGTALYDPDDEFPIKVISTSRTRDPIGLLRTRLERALSRRRNDLLGADSFRLCHGEGDGIPRLFVDRFGDGLCIASVTPAMNDVAKMLVDPLVDITGARVVVHYSLLDKGDKDRSKYRQDAPFHAEQVYGDDAKVRFHHGGLIRHADLMQGFHIPALTARFAIQRYVRRWARGQVLDVMSGFGGFGTQLADAGAKDVLFLDEDADALAALKEDCANNGIAANIRTRAVVPLAGLEQLERDQERFSVIVVHPAEVREPKKQAASVENRVFEMHRAALKLVGEGGIYITWPGSTALNQETFERVLTEAGNRGRKRLQVLARMQAGPDHPVLVGMSDPSATTLLVRVLSTT
ncbi:MAG: methyltransferase [Deltaproteobacteria bacterium]|nr:methyltransferase [Deltaproteobacteria bacterium]